MIKFRSNLISPSHKRITLYAFNALTNSSLFQISQQNPNHPTQFQDFAQTYKISQSQHDTQPHSSPVLGKDGDFLGLDIEKSELLIRRYQHSSGQNNAKQLHLQIIKNGFGADVFLSNTLVNVYVRTADMVSAYDVFDEMPVRNFVSWACLISGYNQNQMPHEACAVFKDMGCAGFHPNDRAIGSALRACQMLRSDGLQFGLLIHALVSKTPFKFDAVVSNGLISMYGNCTVSADEACRVFYEIQTKNIISWNSAISVFSQRGDALSAFELFSKMQQDESLLNPRPTEYTLGSLITAASSSVNYSSNLLEQMLAAIVKLGFLQDLYVGSALVNGFGKLGFLKTAKEIFEQMGTINAVSVNGLMVGFVRQKQGEEAAKIFSKGINVIKKNPDSYVTLISSFAEFSDSEQGRRKGQEVHAYVMRTGLINSKIAIGNGLVNMYSKCEAVDDAYSVFEHMTQKDPVSWNSIITCLDQNEHFEDAIMSFYAMRKTSLMPSNFSLISALSSCSSLGWIKMGTQIHCEGLKIGLDSDVSVSNSLLSLYSEIGYLKDCKKVFKLMREYDKVSWNTMIGAFTESGSIEYFLKMMRAGWNLNRVTLINIISLVSSHSLHELGRQIHVLAIKYNFTNDTAIDNALISSYGKCGFMKDCENIFFKMSEKDEVSWNSMISGYIHNELLNHAVDFVWVMLKNGERLDCFTFATVLSACASVATLERGMEVHACGIRAYLESDVVIGSAIVDMYAKCGRIDYALRFFKLMPVKNVYSWNSMICGYARHGQGQNALDLFKKMKQESQSPDHVTFVGVLSACGHVGLVDQGFKHFESMTKDYNLTPKIEHYSCMIDLLGRAGQIEKIEKFLNTMPMNPNALIWRTILGACCRANCPKTDLGQKAAQMLFNLEPENAVNYVLLSNMYASIGKWDEMSKTRFEMRGKKETGCSWVTMKDGVHVFVAGDSSHPDKDCIYDKLKELYGKMKDLGYVPETKFSLHDLELENQEELLSYHSEKLAIAFVLTRESQLPIRIMKNLRVCGDCHSAFKYISKIVQRPIVLRDLNRFHHFLDGKCSCGDYW